MLRHRLALLLAAALLGLGVAGCGNDDESRQQVEKSNQGQDVPPGSPGTVETNPSGLTSTGPSETTVTQPETDGP